jgi:hypothetical protein
MIDPDKTAFTAPSIARQFAKDTGDRCTPEEAFKAVRSDMLLGLLPKGSCGWAPDATLREAFPEDYPDIEYIHYVKMPPDGTPQANALKIHTAEIVEECREFEELTPPQILEWLADGKDPIAWKWATSQVGVEEACRQVARSPVPAVGEAGRNRNESLALTREGVRAFYGRRGVAIPTWAAEPLAREHAAVTSTDRPPAERPGGGPMPNTVNLSDRDHMTLCELVTALAWGRSMPAKRYLARLQTTMGTFDRWRQWRKRPHGWTVLRRLRAMRDSLAKVDAATATVDWAIKSGDLTPAGYHKGTFFDSLPRDSRLRCDPAHDELVLAVTDATTAEEWRQWRDEGSRWGVRFDAASARAWLRAIAPRKRNRSQCDALWHVTQYAESAGVGRASENGALRMLIPEGFSKRQVRTAWSDPSLAKYHRDPGGKLRSSL